MSDEDEVLLQVDSRKRISLGSLAKHDQYLVAVYADGSLFLRPAVVMPLERSQELHEAERILRERQTRLDDEPPF